MILQAARQLRFVYQGSGNTDVNYMKFSGICGAGIEHMAVFRQAEGAGAVRTQRAAQHMSG